jgi:type III secretion system FlhB-like substrate exporter
VRTDKTAVAIKYVKDLPAPFIVAKGKDELARRLLRIAMENGVEIANEPELTDALFEFEIGSFIPEEMYEIIAHILAHIMKVRK